MRAALYPAFLLSLPFLAGCSAAPSGEGPSSAVPVVAAPEFEARLLDGKDFRLASLKGEVVLMDFWATWCDPCRESAPVFQALSEKYKSRGFRMLGVNVDAEPDDVPSFVAEEGVSYSIVLDTDNAVSGLYRVHGLPSLFLLDKKGRVREHWVGWDESLRPELESDIQALLQEKA